MNYVDFDVTNMKAIPDAISTVVHTVVRNSGTPLKINIETVLLSAQKAKDTLLLHVRVTNSNKSAEIEMKYSIVQARSTYYSDKVISILRRILYGKA